MLCGQICTRFGILVFLFEFEVCDNLFGIYFMGSVCRGSEFAVLLKIGFMVNTLLVLLC